MAQMEADRHENESLEAGAKRVLETGASMATDDGSQKKRLLLPPRLAEQAGAFGLGGRGDAGARAARRLRPSMRRTRVKESLASGLRRAVDDRQHLNPATPASMPLFSWDPSAFLSPPSSAAAAAAATTPLALIILNLPIHRREILDRVWASSRCPFP